MDDRHQGVKLGASTNFREEAKQTVTAADDEE